MGFEFDLVTPTIFGVCPFRHVLGLDLDSILAPIRREGAVGGSVRGQWFPCELNDGENAMVPIGSWGVFGFAVRNIGGVSRLIVYLPPQLATHWEQRVPERTRGRAYEGGIEGAVTRAYVMNLAPGNSASLNIPAIGDVTISVPGAASLAPLPR